MTMPESQTILMYHGIGEKLNPQSTDFHYAVSESTFSTQLSRIRDAGMSGCSVKESVENLQSAPIVNITFDDGHESHCRAAQILAQFEMTADFFVNPGTIGKPGYLSWAALREMAELGMSIQSHGMTHRYMDEHDQTALQEELGESKLRIEQEIGHPVTLLAPPGGRMGPTLDQQCQQIGYRAICTSVAGYWQLGEPVPSGGPLRLPRLAVLNATGVEQFGRWINADETELARMTRRYRVLQAAKRALGNRTYDAMRAMAVRVMP